MEIKELQNIIQENGVVGAGGAGFPTYMKISDKANTILMNCAECEPLLKLHRQLLEKHAYEIMKTFNSTIIDELGIHARPAGMLVKTAKELDSEITIKKGDKTAGASKLMMIMGLGVKKGDTVVVTIDGGDEEKSYTAMKDFFESNL